MREKYETLSLATLKELAKERGMRGISTLKKVELIEAMLRQDEKDTAGARSVQEDKKNIAGEPSAPRQEKATVMRERRPSALRQEKVRMDAGTVPEEGKTETAVPSEGGNTTEERQESRQQPAANPSGDTRNIRTSGNRTRNNQARRTSTISRPENQEEHGRRNGMQQGRTYVARTQNPDSSEQQRFGRGQRNCQERSNHTGTGSARTSARREYTSEVPAAAMAVSEEHTREAAQTEPRISREERMSSEPSGTAATSVGTNPEQESCFDRPPVDIQQLDSGQEVSGILEMVEGYGFLRCENYMPGENDIYVSPSQIRRFNLKTGDIVCGNTRISTMQEKYNALLYLKSVNGMPPSEATRRYNFEDMTPIFPDERLCMERGSRAIAMRIVDLFSPIGKGQRGMIVSPPKAGKTTLLKDVAHSILQNDPDMQLIILLIDERPEEVTDIKEAIQGDNVEVIYSTFDELPEHHKRVSEMVIERAKRLVEHRKNVTILLDSITRLARAYNMTVPPSGRTLSGGLDPAALHMPKRFFGAARNMREGGSLTILATALVDTGSKMDDVVYEEFKGTGNMELVLDRKLSEKRVFPAIDIPKSGTRREDLLLTKEEQEAVYIMRRALNGMKSEEAVENILNMFVHTKDNQELVARVRRQKYV